MVALFMPVGLKSLLQAFMSDTMSYIFILLIGIVFILTHRLWIGNIYRRMMKRKYENLEGFMTVDDDGTAVCQLMPDRI